MLRISVSAMVATGLLMLATVPNAWAADGGKSGMQMALEFLPLVLLGLVFWFLIIRPQMKRSKEHRELVGALSKGDEVVTSGGIVGTVVKVEPQFVLMEVSDKVELRFQKVAITATLPKGTLKALDP